MAHHSTPTVDGIVVGLMVELISTLALVTRRLKKRRWRESFLAACCLTHRDVVICSKNFFAVKVINVARQSLGRLLQEGDRAVRAQAVGTQGPVLVDGERIPSGCDLPVS